MTQQHGIVLIVDVEAALQTGTLEGCSYFFDNAGPFGSTGLGTGNLVSALHGTYWSDGTQASQPILNFLVTGITSLPITLPRNYAAIWPAIVEGQKNLRATSYLTGVHGHVLLDQTGQPVGTANAKLESTDVAQPPPVITNISGDAVEKGIIFPAQYGSPDLVNGGWYWSATVATFSPGIWSYTLHVLIHRLVIDAETQQHLWEPVPLTCSAKLNISTRPMRNGFTGAGVGLLPIGVPPWWGAGR